MIKAAVIMDPIESINAVGDGTLGIMLAAKTREWQLDYVTKNNLIVANGTPAMTCQQVDVFDDPQKWFALGEKRTKKVAEYDVILMRLEPPVDTDFMHVTHFLDLNKKSPPLIVNAPNSLRSLNEKIFAVHFSDLMASHIISSDITELAAFNRQHSKTVFKPLDGSVGRGIFVLPKDDMNVRTLLESMTHGGSHPIMAQEYLPGILKNGDRRVHIINGEAYPHMLVRIPSGGDFRANLAAGAQYRVEEIGKAEQRICERVGPHLVEQGVIFAGLDIIDGKLSEINLTCPTGMRQIAGAGNGDPSERLIEEIEMLCEKK